jgi:hypothetical protein
MENNYVFDIESSMFGDGKVVSIANVFDTQEEAELFVKNLKSLLNTDKSTTPQPDTSNAADIPDLSKWKEGLRYRFLNECVVNDSMDGLKIRTDYSPFQILQWFASFFIPIIERLQENYHQINELYQGFWKENKYLTHENERLQEENTELKALNEKL